MRSVLYTLQKLQEQEKKQKQRELARAQIEESAQEQEVLRLQNLLEEERLMEVSTAGEMFLHDRLLYNRYYEIVSAETVLSGKQEQVQVCQEELRYARQISKITENVIGSMEEKMALQRKRKQEKEMNDISILGWWRQE